MQGMTQPIIKDVVLVGAGHAHVTVLRMFGMDPIPGVRFTLITREVHTLSGMLPGLSPASMSSMKPIDTGLLSRFANARLYQDEVVDLDLTGKRAICRNRPPVPYDLLLLNIGSTPTPDPSPAHRTPYRSSRLMVSSGISRRCCREPFSATGGAGGAGWAGQAVSSCCCRSSIGCGTKLRRPGSRPQVCRSC